MKNLAVGVDIGGTNTAIGIVNQEGDVVVKGGIATPSHGDAEKYIEDLASTIKEMIESAKKEDNDIEIIGIGVGAPNGNYYTGTIEYAPNLSFKGVVPFCELLKKQFPELDNIHLTNDANAAAIGEMVYGGAKEIKNFAMYTLGTGVGSGLVVNGDLVYGHDGFAGECGHTMLIPNGRLCGCGQKGHLEAYCSAPGMKRTAFEIMARDNATDSLLADKTFAEMESKDIYDAAVKGDKVALEVFETTGKYLGQGLADTVHHNSPEAIFLFGGPLAAGDYILKPTKESFEAHLLPIFKNKIEIRQSQLNAGDAAIVGASALAWKETMK